MDSLQPMTYHGHVHILFPLVSSCILILGLDAPTLDIFKLQDNTTCQTFGFYISSKIKMLRSKIQ